MDMVCVCVQEDASPLLCLPPTWQRGELVVVDRQHLQLTQMTKLLRQAGQPIVIEA